MGDLDTKLGRWRSGTALSLDCKTVGFFLKISKEIGNAWRKTLMRANRAREKKRISPVSLSVFSLVPHLLFDCSRVLEYAKIRTVLQSTLGQTNRQIGSQSTGQLTCRSANGRNNASLRNPKIVHTQEPITHRSWHKLLLQGFKRIIFGLRTFFL